MKLRTLIFDNLDEDNNRDIDSQGDTTLNDSGTVTLARVEIRNQRAGKGPPIRDTGDGARLDITCSTIANNESKTPQEEIT